MLASFFSDYGNPHRVESMPEYCQRYTPKPTIMVDFIDVLETKLANLPQDQIKRLLALCKKAHKACGYFE